MDDRGTSDAETGGASDADRDASETGDREVASADDGAESGGADRRLWLVERTYTDKGLVSLVYATADGEYSHHRQRSMNALQQGADVTAAIDADAERLDPVDDAETRERYAEEASRMADQHDPDDAV